jgi:hypothetical protein
MALQQARDAQSIFSPAIPIEYKKLKHNEQCSLNPVNEVTIPSNSGDDDFLPQVHRRPVKLQFKPGLQIPNLQRNLTIGCSQQQQPLCQPLRTNKKKKRFRHFKRLQTTTTWTSRQQPGSTSKRCPDTPISTRDVIPFSFPKISP